MPLRSAARTISPADPGPAGVCHLPPDVNCHFFIFPGGATALVTSRDTLGLWQMDNLTVTDSVPVVTQDKAQAGR